MAATADRVFSVFKLFTAEQPVWTVEAIASQLNVSVSTAYLYVGSLVKAEMLVAGIGGIYLIGPAVTVYDRTVRLTDPLTALGRPILQDLVLACGDDAIGMTCRHYRERVMCVDLYGTGSQGIKETYDRGLAMPLTEGAHAQVILAHLPLRAQRSLFARQTDAANAAGLGPDWKAFKKRVLAIRRMETLVLNGSQDGETTGVAAAIFGHEQSVLGSMGVLVNSSTLGSARLQQIRDAVLEASKALSLALRVKWEVEYRPGA